MVEFPQYDFFPTDYGEFQSVLMVDRHLQTSTIGDESGEVPVGVIATTMPQNPKAEITSAVLNTYYRIAIASPVLASRIGVQVEQVSFPFIGGGKDGRRRLKMMATLMLQKKLAQANVVDQQFVYRPFILPNKPVYNRARERIGLSGVVSHSMPLFGECNTSVELQYVRQALRPAVPNFVLKTRKNEDIVLFSKVFGSDRKELVRNLGQISKEEAERILREEEIKAFRESISQANFTLITGVESFPLSFRNPFKGFGSSDKGFVYDPDPDGQEE